MATLSCAVLPPENVTDTPTESPVYQTLSAAEAAQQQNLVGGGNTFEFVCYKGQITDSVQFALWTTDSTHRVTVRANAGQEAKGVRYSQGGDGFSMTSATRTYDCRVDMVTQDIEIESTATGSNVVNTGAGPIDADFKRCLLIGETAVASIISVQLANTGTALLENCLIHGGAWTVYPTSPAVTVSNCTMTSEVGSWLIYCNSNVALYNNVAIGTSNNYRDYNTVVAGSRGNASDDTTGDITGVSTTPGVDFVDPSANNWRISDSSTLLKDVGDGTGLGFTNDIALNERPVLTEWELGCYEIVSAGPTPAVLSNPTVTPAETSALIGCTTDTADGTLYWYVSESDQAPSATDLKAGTGSVAFGNLVPSLGANTDTATGLTASTQYWHYWIQETT